MSQLKVTAGPYVFGAKFEEQAHQDRGRLPEADAVHLQDHPCALVGRRCLDAARRSRFRRRLREQHLLPLAGQIILYPGGVSEDRDPAGLWLCELRLEGRQLSGNHFITLTSGWRTSTRWAARCCWKASRTSASTWSEARDGEALDACARHRQWLPGGWGVVIELVALGADGSRCPLKTVTTNQDGRTDQPLLAGSDLSARHLRTGLPRRRFTSARGGTALPSHRLRRCRADPASACTSGWALSRAAARQPLELLDLSGQLKHVRSGRPCLSARPEGSRPQSAPCRLAGGARIAVQFVINYEEGGENCLLHGDAGSEAFLSEIVGAAAWPAQRHMNMESIYEYGARAG